MFRPQAKFPVHEGILDYHGKNTVVVVLWAMEANANIQPTLRLVVDGQYETGMGAISTVQTEWITRTDAV